MDFNSSTPRPTFHFVAADVEGATWFYWFDWADPSQFTTAQANVADYGPALDRFTDAVPHDPSTIMEILHDPIWTDPAASRQIMKPLADAFMPPAFLEAIRVAAASGTRPLIHLGPSPRWARVPWELLPVDDDMHLIELADIVVPGVNVPLLDDRRRTPQPIGPGSQALYVIDPVVEVQVLVDRYAELESWADYADERGGWVVGQDTGWRVDRETLGHALRSTSPPSRLLYLGHCRAPSEQDKPTTAGLVLADEEGTTYAPRRSDTQTYAGSRFVPLSAVDLIYGRAKEGPNGQKAGWGDEIWPMPPRVGLVACGSGDDAAYHEPLGLVSACVNSGAEYVVATRWTVPADIGTDGATTHMARDIDAILASEDPARSMSDWQMRRFHSWQADPADVRNSPSLWAAVQLFIAHPRVEANQPE